MEKHPNLEVGRAPISLQWRKKLIMVMKCLFFLLLVCHFNVFSEISAQRVARFRMENADLKSCIQQASVSCITAGNWSKSKASRLICRT